MNVERGLRRLVLVCSIASGFGVFTWMLVSSYRPPSQWAPPLRLADWIGTECVGCPLIIPVLLVTAMAAATPWAIYWVVRWIIRGFRN